MANCRGYISAEPYDSVASSCRLIHYHEFCGCMPFHLFFCIKRVGMNEEHHCHRHQLCRHHDRRQPPMYGEPGSLHRHDIGKIDRLNEGILPIHEPGPGRSARNMTAGRLRFTTSHADGMREAELPYRRGNAIKGTVAPTSQVRQHSPSPSIRLTRSMLSTRAHSTVPNG